MRPLLLLFALQPLQADEPVPTTVHCVAGGGLSVDGAPAPPCPFTLAPDQTLTLPAGTRVVLDGQGLRPWTGPRTLAPGPARWEGAAESLEGAAARAWLERVGESDLALLTSLETGSLVRAAQREAALEVIEAALAETPGHRGLLALRQVHRHALGLPAAETHLIGPALAGDTPGDEGELARNVFGPDDRVPVTSRSYPWRAIGLFKPGLCTGSLVADRWVLTAAHCITKQGDRSVLRDGPITFHAGAQGGYSAVNARTVGAFIPDGWTRGGDRGSDWALVELDKPLGDQQGWFGIAPTTLSTINRAQRYQQAGYSYDRLNGRTATADTDCGIRGTSYSAGTLLVDCDIAQGDSGSPMFVDASGGAIIHALMVAEYRYDSADTLYLSAYSDTYASLAIPLAAAAAELTRLKAQVHKLETSSATYPLYTKGRQQLVDGLPSTAARTFERCLAIDSAHTGCWWELGWAHWVLRDFDRTVSCWDIVQRLDPHFPELSTYLPQARQRAAGAW